MPKANPDYPGTLDAAHPIAAAEPMPADELRQWFRYIEYQNRLIIWALSGHKPSQRPYPPAGVIETRHPDGTEETRIDL